MKGPLAVWIHSQKVFPNGQGRPFYSLIDKSVGLAVWLHSQKVFPNGQGRPFYSLINKSVGLAVWLNSQKVFSKYGVSTQNA